MMECKQALSEAGGDADTAIKLLQEKLGKQMQDRSDRAAGEGALASAKSDGAVTLIELASETDFAARNDSFINAAEKIAKLALDAPAGAIEPTDEMKAVVENLRITIKENISLRRGVKLTGAKVGSYVHHNRKVGTIIAAEGDVSDDLLTGICQHVTATVSPMTAALAVDEAGLPKEKYEEAKAQAVQEVKDLGKPQEIAEKIATGKMRKWVDEHTLLGQIYLREMDAKKPIRDYLPKGAKVLRFVKYELGGGGSEG
jgi:elongation factor Ts